MSDRIYSLDVMRPIAMLAVVIIHTDPFAGLTAVGNFVNLLLTSTARFGVPFFFLTAGYLFALKIEVTPPRVYFERYVKRIAGLYVFGVLLYVFVDLLQLVWGRILSRAPPGLILRDVIHTVLQAFSPMEFIYGGRSVSAIFWFLPALAFAIAAVYVFVRADAVSYLLPVATLLHAIGLFGQSYGHIFSLPVRTRDAAFFGLFFVSVGFTIRRSDWSPSHDRWHWFFGLFLTFLLLHHVEWLVVGYLIQGNMLAKTVWTPDFTILTAPMAIALFCALLARPNWGAESRLIELAPYAVGVYVVHPALRDLIEQVVPAVESLAGASVTGSIAWHILYTPALFALSLLVYVAILRLRGLSPEDNHFPRFRALVD